MPNSPSPSAGGSFAPLRQPVFAVLWAAAVLGNVGSFMRDVASSWLVTDLSASPAAVALIQTAATLPITAPVPVRINPSLMKALRIFDLENPIDARSPTSVVRCSRPTAKNR